jgi:alkanesulfonate monooxygenase SsuD/methylene tetrahydromethanopterin reductase-like flavin-dependent oxidoreductase (luciferase family)
MRLGVVLDLRNPAERLRVIARMCELAGIEALWVRDGAPAGARTDSWDGLLAAAGETQRVRLGAMLDVAARSLQELERLLGSPGAASLRPRLEVTLCGGSADGLGTQARALRTMADADPPPVLGVEVVNEETAALAAAIADTALLGAPEGRVGVARGYADAPARRDAEASGGAIEAAGPQVETTGGALRRACLAVGREPGTLGVAVQVPVSIGRTVAEARARADAEPLFGGSGHPARAGIFGTLEMCQDRVIELAHDGVTDLRCVLPNSPDVHDVIAQLTAMVVGSPDVLAPGAPRSRAPDAPAEWGGRPRWR